MPKVLFVVSAALGSMPVDGPRKDFRLIASALQATVIDFPSARASIWMRFLSRIAGIAVVQAWLAFRRRNEFDAILTDGEHIGLPLALMLKASKSPVAHVTIGHRLTAGKKRLFFTWLKVQTHISRIVVHSRAQFELARSELGIDASKLALVPYQVDTQFWQPQLAPEERMVCSAGLEFRDYPTLMRAVDGMDARVMIGAASHWSKRRNSAAGRDYPGNVTVDRFDYHALRELYARSALVVVPLDDTDFQAGITTILEAMAMGKAVVVTHSHGQTDVVEDRRRITRGAVPRVRPDSLLRVLARTSGVPCEPTGFYVLPGDAEALRKTIVYLLDHPDVRQKLGAAGRQAVERFMNVDQYVLRLRELIMEALVESEASSNVAADVAPVAALTVTD